MKPTNLSRRALLLQLGALAACGPKLAPVAAPRAARAQTVRLGWRWIPGLPLTFRSVVTRTLGELSISRAEAWQYTALDLDPTGAVSLRGRLVGFGLALTEGGRPRPESETRAAREAAAARAHQSVDLRMRLTGRLISCSIEHFDAALPHHLLGMNLPVDPAVTGQSWTDTSLALLFAQLVPVDLPVRIEAHTSLKSLQDGPPDTGLQASLDHHTEIRTTDGGPKILLDGTCSWDTDPGAINSRVLTASMSPDPGPDGRAVGSLRAELVRDRRADPVA